MKNIPKREINFQLSKHLVCYLHFEEQFIVNYNFIIQNNVRINYVERKRWKLMSDAVPTKFSNNLLSTNYDKNILRKRKSPSQRTETVSKKPRVTKFVFSHLVCNVPYLVLHNSNWVINSDQAKEIAVFELDKSNGRMLIKKCIVVRFLELKHWQLKIDENN